MCVYPMAAEKKSGDGDGDEHRGIRGATKLDVRQPRDALFGASKVKPLGCKEGSGSGVSLGARQLLEEVYTQTWQDRCRL